MTMTRRPDRAVVPLRTAIQQLMGDWPYVQVDGGLTELAPPIDVRETDDAYMVEVDLPGIDPKNLELLVEGRTLTIRGQMTEEKEEKQGNYLLKERRQGQFMRAVALPAMVDVDKVTSKFENGQLDDHPAEGRPEPGSDRSRPDQVQQVVVGHPGPSRLGATGGRSLSAGLRARLRPCP